MQDGLLAYPFRGPAGAETLVVGGGLHLLAVYLPVAPLLPVVGYLLAVLVHVAGDARAGAHGAPAVVSLPPTGRQLRRLLADGLRGTVVAAGYLAVPAVVVAVTLRGVGSLGAATGGAPTAGEAGVLLVGGTAAFVSAAVFCYPLPAALTAVGRHRSLRAAGSRRLVRAAATDARYFVGWATGLTVLALGGAAGVRLVPVGVGFFLLFYAEVVAAAAWGWGCSRLSI